MKTFENVSIASITTMRLGGIARFVIDIERPEEIAEAYDFAKFNRLPVFVLGSGANTIGRDEGFPGVIIRNRMTGITVSGDSIHAMGGEIWDNVVKMSCEYHLTGIEALSKIPGTAGAAPVQNIGAYGQDISQVLTNIEVYDTVERVFKILSNAELKFGYRKSILNTTERGRYFVVAITLGLKKGQMQPPFYKSLETYIDDNYEVDLSPANIRRMVSAIRADKLPDPVTTPSAGSFFKNVYLKPDEIDDWEAKGYPVYHGKDGAKVNSGWLIEKAGLSGKVFHGIRVNEKASLVLINESAKSYQDLKAAREEIASKVYDKFGFWLEQEPVEIY